MRILKHKLNSDFIFHGQRFTLPLINASVVLSLQWQEIERSFVMWALTPNPPLAAAFGNVTTFENRTFTWYCTGREISDNPGKYIATVQHLLNDEVYHLYEVL